MNTFKFKHFEITHGRGGMKIGTDGVLLGVWARIPNNARILDIGSGTGLISLILAQRSADSFIVAAEINQDAFEEGRDNILKSPWNNRIIPVLTDYRDYIPSLGQKFDLIISNPPFFNNSTLPPSENRTIARHQGNSQQSELLEYSEQHLSPNGVLAVVLPLVEGNNLIEDSNNYKLDLVRKTKVYTRLGKETPKRLLLEFSFDSKKGFIENSLTIQKGGRMDYTEEYLKLVKDFYLFA